MHIYRKEPAFSREGGSIMRKLRKLIPWLLLAVAVALSVVLLVQTYGRQRQKSDRSHVVL